ncbi:MAG: SCO family protein [Anaerolineales bacterium]
MLRRFVGLIGVVLMLGLAGCAPAHELSGSPYQDPQAAPALHLQTTTSEPYVLADHHGQVVLLYFGYTHCPDECPATLSEWEWLADQLGPDRDRVEFVFVTIDPKRDTSTVTRQFLDQFGTDFIGLIGSADQIDVAKAGYGVFAEADDEHDEDSAVTHTSRTFLIGPDGKLLSGYTFDEPRQALLDDVRYLLKTSS